MKPTFKNDYSVLVHPQILEAIIKYSNEVNIPYGLDYHSENAAKYIKEVFKVPHADIHFVGGGTASNLLIISSALKHYEGVISCDSGHINVHETAAVEGSGYKVITIPGVDGKLKAKDIEEKCLEFSDEHMVKPRMVYLSNSTELGTIYSLKELEDIYKVCKKNDLYLFLDGARLGCALTSKENDIKKEDLGRLCDVFYIGGAKNGLMIGEALVIINDNLKKDFRYHIKNKGAMLSKGYLIGVQFEEAFKNDLYFEISKKVNEVGNYLKESLESLGLEVSPSPTNQIFVKVDKSLGTYIVKEYGCEIWSKEVDKMVVRFVVSFASKKEDVDILINDLKKRI